MVMDIIIGIIFVVTVFLAMRKGFALTVIHFVQVIASLVLGFLFCDDLKLWFQTKTNMAELVTEKVEKHMTDYIVSSWSEPKWEGLLPQILREKMDTATGMLVQDAAQKMIEILLSILSFGLIVIGVSLVCTNLAHFFSKQYNEGFLSFVDWVLGAGMGCCIGIFYVLVFLALITPITEFFMPDLSETLSASFNESYIAGKIYNHNVLLLFFRGLF